MSKVRKAFVDRFGEVNAKLIEEAAAFHSNEVPGDPGSDSFRDALAVVIAWDCAKKETYREHHKITIPWKELRQWIIDKGDFAHHDGPIDKPAFGLGLYTPFGYPKRPTAADVAEATLIAFGQAFGSSSTRES